MTATEWLRSFLYRLEDRTFATLRAEFRWNLPCIVNIQQFRWQDVPVRKIGVVDFSSAEMKFAPGMNSTSPITLRVEPQSVRKTARLSYSSAAIFRDDLGLYQKLTHNN